MGFPGKNGEVGSHLLATKFKIELRKVEDNIKVHIYNPAHKLLNLNHICEEENMDQ